MSVRHACAALAVTAAIVLLGACTSSDAPGDSTAASNARGLAASGTTGGDGANSTSAAGTGPAMDACGLLTVDEIKQATGLAVQPGVLQTNDDGSDRRWEVTGSDTGEVGLTVSAYDDFLWQTGSASTYSKPVSGIGDAAFKGWPVASDLTVNVKDYQVDLAIADFQATQDAVDAANLALAKLVVPRL